MKSKTKFHLDDNAIQGLFAQAGITGVSHIVPLGAGEYNAVYAATSGGQEYALKIAPPGDVEVLSYEKDLMQSEVYWYEQISTHTTIKVPKVYYSDFSKKILPACYFIMEKLSGQQLNEMEFTQEEKAVCIAEKAKMAAQIHTIKGNGFGYIQNGLHDNWYKAIYQMVQALVDDCHKLSMETKSGERLLDYISQYKNILESVECVMVNFDLWDSNVLCTREGKKLDFAWIDPERSFWGDRIADFISMSRDTLEPLSQKADSLAAYNSVAKIPVNGTREENIRYAIALGYLALIQETEKYVRYEPGDKGWTQSVNESESRYGAAFRLLENDGRA